MSGMSGILLILDMHFDNLHREDKGVYEFYSHSNADGHSTNVHKAE